MGISFFWVYEIKHRDPVEKPKASKKELSQRETDSAKKSVASDALAPL
jgi:hypothetical protein